MGLKGWPMAGEDTKIKYMVVNLLKGEQKSDEYAHLNPQKFVPTLIVNDAKLSDKPIVLNESLPICEFLEEAYPETRKLIPADIVLRFKVRRLCEMINAGIQPIQNLGVINEIGARFGQEHKGPWAKWVIERGFESKCNTLC